MSALTYTKDAPFKMLKISVQRPVAFFPLYERLQSLTKLAKCTVLQLRVTRGDSFKVQQMLTDNSFEQVNLSVKSRRTIEAEYRDLSNDHRLKIEFVFAQNV